MTKVSICFSLLAGLTLSPELHADDAQVLPKGRFRARLVSSYSTAQNEFSGGGEIRALGQSFSKRLDSRLLSALNPATGDALRKLNATLPGLNEDVAVDLFTDVETEVFSNIIALEYGLTDRLSVGFLLPIVHARTTVNAEATPDQKLESRIKAMSDADPRKAALKQVQARLNVQTFDATLREGFNYDDGLRSWSGTGLGDLEVGGKYQYYKSPNLQATLKAGVRLPTGRVDDPNKIFDVGFGDGQMDIGAFQLVDIKFSPAWGATFEGGYTMQLPDTSSRRLQISDEIPIGPSTIAYDRKLGDYVNAELEANYTAWRALTLSARYRFKYKMADDYTGPTGVDLSSLEKDTSEMYHASQFQVEYTNLAAFRAGTQKIPYAVGVFYRMPFAGENTSDSRTAGISLKSYF